MCDLQNVKISVIMPVYNDRDYIRPAMDSVLSQTLSEIEVICIDDGSTDSSYEIIKEYQKSDERIRIVTEANAGPALARNNGMRRARGEYLAFLDADDFYEPTFLESLYTYAKKEDLDIAIAPYDIYNSRRARFEAAVEADHYEIYNGGGSVTSKNEHPDTILASTVGSAWNKIFRREFVELKGLSFLQDVKMYEDVYFTVTALSLAERVGVVKGILMHHRVHNEQQRAKVFSKYYSQVPKVYSKIREFLMQKGMFLPLSVSYLNLSASRCYKIYNLLSSESKEKFWDLLHGEYCEKIGWTNFTSQNFEEKDIYDFVVNIKLYNHDQYKKRLAKGLIGAVSSDDSRRNADKKSVGFLSRFFGKRKK